MCCFNVVFNLSYFVILQIDMRVLIVDYILGQFEKGLLSLKLFVYSYKDGVSIYFEVQGWWVYY